MKTERDDTKRKDERDREKTGMRRQREREKTCRPKRKTRKKQYCRTSNNINFRDVTHVRKGFET